MRLYEFEGKRLFHRYGIPTPEGTVLRGPEGLEKVVYPVVLKAQVFAGGRGKAGLVHEAGDRESAMQAISGMIGRVHKGFRVERVLAERKTDVKTELYLGMLIDRVKHRPLVMVSAEGGVDVEEIARERPDSLHRLHLIPGERPGPYLARTLASKMGLRGAELLKAASVIHAAMKLFLDYDCKLLEINPLGLRSDGRTVALDAKVDLDEDALFRHPDLKAMGIEPRHEMGELTERERTAKAAGIPYVDLGGDIGVFPGGAGFGIAAVDLIHHFGGRPANFMDSGGAPTQERLRLMIGLLMDNPDVRAIFGARFGGISRCDDWAEAVVRYVRENEPKKPMIMRMVGNMEKEGREIFERAMAETPELFRKIKIYRSDTPIEDVIQEAIRAAQGETGAGGA
jgi:succinyl-CoA synthetase beta subunit